MKCYLAFYDSFFTVKFYYAFDGGPDAIGPHEKENAYIKEFRY